MSLRWYLKILSAFLLVILIIVVPSAFYLGSNLKQFLMDQKEEELRRELTLAAKMAADTFNTGPQDREKIQRLALEVGADIQKRVTIISRDGRVLGDSGLTHEAVGKMEDHSNRPEILAAKNTGFGRSVRFSTTLQATTLYGAVPIVKDNNLSGYVRLALPLSQVEALVSGLRRNLLLAGVMTGILAILLSFFLTWSINRPLREITGMVKGMADGDLKQPFHLLPKTEFRDLASSLEHMADELTEKMERLDRETNQLTTLLSTMREGVLITDEKGRIILMNPFLQEVLGPKVSWKKRTVQEIFMNSELQDAVDSVLKNDTFLEIPLVYGRTPQYHFEVHIASLAPAHRSRRAVALFHDTTKLQYLLKVRQDFVANASHELRTPLTSINGYVETLISLVPDDPSEIRRFLSVIQKNVKQMGFLVSDLLDLAKLDQEKTKSRMEQIQVKEVLAAAVQMIKDQAREKGIYFLEQWDTLGDDLKVFWEKERMVQAIFNLLDNAVKYTPAGGRISLIAKTVRSSETSASLAEPFGVQNMKELHPELITKYSELNRDFVEISVEDTGIGIPKEHLSRIFERFYRVDKARSRDLGGTGLGLAIVKHIVETHGGTIQVQSTLGQGSTFSLILPLKQLQD
ncbi:MAG: HAMP domain-containing protein [Deltaproteobacteria bacterium]|nr:HAMP domain-containing protein [Deltaproteobacteria bacterium]